MNTIVLSKDVFSLSDTLRKCGTDAFSLSTRNVSEANDNEDDQARARMLIVMVNSSHWLVSFTNVAVPRGVERPIPSRVTVEGGMRPLSGIIAARIVLGKEEKNEKSQEDETNSQGENVPSEVDHFRPVQGLPFRSFAGYVRDYTRRTVVRNTRLMVKLWQGKRARKPSVNLETSQQKKAENEKVVHSNRKGLSPAPPRCGVRLTSPGTPPSEGSEKKDVGAYSNESSDPGALEAGNKSTPAVKRALLKKSTHHTSSRSSSSSSSISLTLSSLPRGGAGLYQISGTDESSMEVLSEEEETGKKKEEEEEEEEEDAGPRVAGPCPCSHRFLVSDVEQHAVWALAVELPVFSVKILPVEDFFADEKRPLSAESKESSYASNSSSGASELSAMPLLGGAKGFLDGHFSIARFNQPTALCWKLDEIAASDTDHATVPPDPSPSSSSYAEVLFISDSGNRAIRCANFTTRLVRTIVGLSGMGGYRNGVCLHAMLCDASSMEWGASFGLIFADGPNGVLRKITGIHHENEEEAEEERVEAAKPQASEGAKADAFVESAEGLYPSVNLPNSHETQTRGRGSDTKNDRNVIPAVLHGGEVMRVWTVAGVIPPDEPPPSSFSTPTEPGHELDRAEGDARLRKDEKNAVDEEAFPAGAAPGYVDRPQSPKASVGYPASLAILPNNAANSTNDDEIGLLFADTTSHAIRVLDTQGLRTLIGPSDCFTPLPLAGKAIDKGFDEEERLRRMPRGLVSVAQIVPCALFKVRSPPIGPLPPHSPDRTAGDEDLPLPFVFFAVSPEKGVVSMLIPSPKAYTEKIAAAVEGGSLTIGEVRLPSRVHSPEAVSDENDLRTYARMNFPWLLPTAPFSGVRFSSLRPCGYRLGEVKNDTTSFTAASSVPFGKEIRDEKPPSRSLSSSLPKGCDSAHRHLEASTPQREGATMSDSILLTVSSESDRTHRNDDATSKTDNGVRRVSCEKPPSDAGADGYAPSRAPSTPTRCRIIMPPERSPPPLSASPPPTYCDHNQENNDNPNEKEKEKGKEKPKTAPSALPPLARPRILSYHAQFAESKAEKKEKILGVVQEFYEVAENDTIHNLNRGEDNTDADIDRQTKPRTVPSRRRDRQSGPLPTSANTQANGSSPQGKGMIGVEKGRSLLAGKKTSGEASSPTLNSNCGDGLSALEKLLTLFKYFARRQSEREASRATEAKDIYSDQTEVFSCYSIPLLSLWRFLYHMQYLEELMELVKLSRKSLPQQWESSSRGRRSPSRQSARSHEKQRQGGTFLERRNQNEDVLSYPNFSPAVRSEEGFYLPLSAQDWRCLVELLHRRGRQTFTFDAFSCLIFQLYNWQTLLKGYFDDPKACQHEGNFEMGRMKENESFDFLNLLPSVSSFDERNAVAAYTDAYERALKRVPGFSVYLQWCEMHTSLTEKKKERGGEGHHGCVCSSSRGRNGAKIERSRSFTPIKELHFTRRCMAQPGVERKNEGEEIKTAGKFYSVSALTAVDDVLLLLQANERALRELFDAYAVPSRVNSSSHAHRKTSLSVSSLSSTFFPDVDFLWKVQQLCTKEGAEEKEEVRWRSSSRTFPVISYAAFQSLFRAVDVYPSLLNQTVLSRTFIDALRGPFILPGKELLKATCDGVKGSPRSARKSPRRGVGLSAHPAANRNPSSGAGRGFHHDGAISSSFTHSVVEDADYSAFASSFSSFAGIDEVALRDRGALTFISFVEAFLRVGLVTFTIGGRVDEAAYPTPAAKLNAFFLWINRQLSLGLVEAREGGRRPRIVELRGSQRRPQTKRPPPNSAWIAPCAASVSFPLKMHLFKLSPTTSDERE